MRGIRWIIGLPTGYGVYQFIGLLNAKFIAFVGEFLSFIPVWLWQLETIIISGMIGTYIGLAVTYFMLPFRIGPINQTKIRVIYWAISIITVLQLITLGAMVFESLRDYQDGMAAQIFYTVAVIGSMWITYGGVAAVDFRHNQQAREYFYLQSLEENMLTDDNNL